MLLKNHPRPSRRRAALASRFHLNLDAADFVCVPISATQPVYAPSRAVPQTLMPSDLTAQMEAATSEILEDRPGITAFDALRGAVDIVECEVSRADNLRDLAHWQRGNVVEQFWNWALDERNQLEDRVEALAIHRRNLAPVARMASFRGFGSAIVREYESACAQLLDAQDELDAFSACRDHIDRGDGDYAIDASDPAVMRLWERFNQIWDVAFCN